MEKIKKEDLLECIGGGFFSSLLISLINLTTAVIFFRKARR